jgi:hypothetical protein
MAAPAEGIAEVFGLLIVATSIQFILFVLQ